MDRYRLKRFLRAQEPDYPQALAEIRAGQKRTHWIWYIFPQIQGLGSSQISQTYAITSLDEARAYLQHPVLGARLVACAEALLTVTGKSATEILGSPDDLKVRSCMTLFTSIEGSPPVFSKVLEKYYGGKPDDLTLLLLNRGKNR